MSRKEILYDPANPPAHDSLRVLNTFETCSPSAMGTYKGCPRRWHLGRICGLTRPSTDQQNHGTQVHAQMEDYCNLGIEPTMPEAKALKAYIPPPFTKGVLVEHEFHFETGVTGVQAHGYIDHVFVPEDASQPIVVSDYKTTKAIKYAKTPEYLYSDPQMVTYASAMLRHTKRRGFVHARHLTAQRLVDPKPDAVAKSKEAGVTYVAEEIESLWRDLEITTITPMADDAVKDWRDVKPEFEHCFKYYGSPCEFVPICYAHDGKRTPKQEGWGDMDFSKVEVDQMLNSPESESTTPKAKPGITLADLLPTFEAKPAKPAETSQVLKRPGLRLLVNCAPQLPTLNVVYFDEELPGLCRETAMAYTAEKAKEGKNIEVSDARIIPYGEGPARVALALTEKIKAGLYDNRTVVIIPSGTMTEALTGVFAAHAVEIIRNIR